MGRKKLQIRKITNNKFRYVHHVVAQVTFTKRRIGLFKKAAEIALLCSSKVTIKIEDEFGNMSQFTSDRKFLADDSKQPFHAVFPIEQYPQFKNYVMTDDKGRLTDVNSSTSETKETTPDQISYPKHNRQIQSLNQIVPAAFNYLIYPIPSAYLQS